MKKLLNQTYEDKWYKVWYRDTFYNGVTYVTFQYAFGDEHVKRVIRDYKGFKVTVWE